MTDWIPGVSQAKSLYQWAWGDADAALETQKNFVKKCPGVSHAVGGASYAYGYVSGDNEYIDYGTEALKQGTQTIGNIANGIPVVGHIKGGIHHMCGDTEGGNRALVSATRTTVVMGSGAAGFVVGGPMGAAAAGAGAGVAFDGMHTIAEGNKDGPHGVWSLGEKSKSGDYFDAVVGILGDGFTGYAAGTYVDQKLRADQIQSRQNIQKVTDAIADKNLEGSVWTEVTDLETGKTYVGVNKKFRKAAKLTEPRNPNPNLFVDKNPIDGSLPIDRMAQTCAETHAYHQLIADNPGADLANTRVNTFKFENGEFRSLTRCDNCMTRSHVMGDVPTDPVVRFLKISCLLFISTFGNIFYIAYALCSI